MMEEKYKELFEYISKTDSSCAQNILYSIELLRSSFDHTINRINDEISSAAGSRDYANVVNNSKYCKQMLDIDIELQEVLSYLSEYVEDDLQQMAKKFSDPEKLRKEVVERIDYSKYDVSKYEKHGLNEKFTFKRPYALEIPGKMFLGNSWNKLIAELCGYLYKKDSQKMRSFITSPRYQGRKINYFTTYPVERKNVQIPGTDMYVWTNMSANDIVKKIKQILEDYNIESDQSYVYLTRDLSPRHAK